MAPKRLTAICSTLLFLATAACESGGTRQSPDDQTSAQSQSDSVQTGTSGMVEPVETSDDGDRLAPGDVPPVGSRLELSEKEWRERLTEQEFHILRENGTEPSGSSDLLDEKREGIYYCAGCGAPVFSSRHKYGSNTGWPSFYRPYDSDRLGTEADRSLGMVRTEVHCARCGGHLGHVFDDGPEPTGLRYCINGAALDFKPVSELQSGDGQTDAGSSGDTGSPENRR